MGLFKAKPFSGGVKLHEHKTLTNQLGIGGKILPKRVFLGLQQRNGAQLHSLVKAGDTVYKGQLIAKGSNPMCVPLHSPINGTVTEIKSFTTAHPAGIKCPTLVITSSGDHRWGESFQDSDSSHLSSDEIIDRILDAGIVGLGGAGFPTGLKLRLAKQKNIQTLLINGGECEPYLTCDDALMQEKASEIVAGVAFMIQAIECPQAIIAIEDNKPESIAAMTHAASEHDNIIVKSVPSLYPMGSERHLIKAATNLTVPAGQLSTEIGVLVHNVATAKAVFDAVRFKRPLIERVITISGGAIENPANLIVPIGTLVSEALSVCGGLKINAERIIAGGPMMGQVIPSPHSPIDKSIGGLVALSEAELGHKQVHDCVRCGRCVNACPMGLMPFQMATHSRGGDIEGAQHYGLEHCILCGACSYVCPSSIPLVQHFQHAKGTLNARRAMEAKSSRVRLLTEAKKLRIFNENEAKKAAKAAKAAKKNKRRRPPITADKIEITTDLSLEKQTITNEDKVHG